MRAEFSEEGASLMLSPMEYGFLFRCLSDRVETLPQWEVGPRLGIEYDEARSLIDQLVGAEREARASGSHWLEAQREPPSDD
jgi:hypothetical protein